MVGGAWEPGKALPSFLAFLHVLAKPTCPSHLVRPFGVEILVHSVLPPTPPHPRPLLYGASWYSMDSAQCIFLLSDHLGVWLLK